MTRKSILLSMVIVLLLALALAVPALAGGWAVVTLDSLPGPLTSGQPASVGFTIRQHGRTPWVYDGVRVEATHTASGQKYVVPARAEGAPGHYTAELALPKAGAWSWGVVSGLYPEVQPMPELTVVEAGGASSSAASGSGAAPIAPASSALPAVLSTLAGLAVLAATAWALARRRSRAGLAVALLAVAVALAVFAAAPRLSRAQEAPALQAAGLQPQPQPNAQQGEALFIAKGCVVCHTQPSGTNRISIDTQEVGANLANVSFTPEYLRLWLADPASIKPQTAMPDLDLTPAEIEALIAYLGSAKK